MIFFTIKLLKNVRKAIAGRKYPNQLAWALAFGVLLGIVPHGNLLALAILVVVLSLQINHAMAGIAAIAATFAAYKLDPLSDRVGTFVLTHETTGPWIAKAWQLPLVPWTDINNTVVIGSFLIGVAALIPIFLLTYPFFKLSAPSNNSPDDEHVAEAAVAKDAFVIVDRAQQHATPPRYRDTQPAPVATPALAVASGIRSDLAPSDFASGDFESGDSLTSESPSSELVDQYLATIDKATDEVPDEVAAESAESSTAAAEIEDQVSVETRIDVIRMKDYRDLSASAAAEQANSTSTGGDSTDEEPLDEALSYLLRQLRDSQQRKAG